MTEQHVNFVARHSVPKAMTLEEVEAATNQVLEQWHINGTMR